MKIYHFSAVILNGGDSSRMGMPKHLLQFDRQHTFLEKIMAIYREAGISDIHCVFNHRLITSPEFYKSFPGNPDHLIINTRPEAGRTYSILLGLDWIPEENACFIQNIDNPFISSGMLKDMMKLLIDRSYVVPFSGGTGGHPVLISPFIRKEITGTRRTDMSLKELLSGFDRVDCPAEDEGPFININTPEEYKKYTGYEIFGNRLLNNSPE